jgi:hypothetical protein
MKKVLYGVLMLGWIPTLAVLTGAGWMGEAFAQGRTPVKVTRLYTGPDGKTKAEEFEIPVKPRDGGSDVSGAVAVTSLQVRRTNQDYYLDWHTAPRRQLVVTLSGESEIELEGGRKMRLGPGHILLAEDTTGQGHISRAVKGKDRIALDIVLAEGATLPR